jgi:hypothetical protein
LKPQTSRREIIKINKIENNNNKKNKESAKQKVVLWKDKLEQQQNPWQI